MGIYLPAYAGILTDMTMLMLILAIIHKEKNIGFFLLKCFNF